MDEEKKIGITYKIIRARKIFFTIKIIVQATKNTLKIEKLQVGVDLLIKGSYETGTSIAD